MAKYSEENSALFLDDLKAKKSAKKCFEDEIFHTELWAKPETFKEESFQMPAESKEETPEVIEESPEIVSKKEVQSPYKLDVMQELKKFADEKLNESDSNKFKFKGGELSSGNSGESCINLFDFESEIIAQRNSVKVIFISTNDRAENLEKLLDKTDELLSNIVSAMKLSPEDFSFWFGLSDDEKSLENCCKVVMEKRPQFVITLGGKASNIILKINERLQNIHGRLFERSIKNKDEEFIFQIMPVFHPDYLLVNPKMKKTAWEDLQKIMEKIK